MILLLYFRSSTERVRAARIEKMVLNVFPRRRIELECKRGLPFSKDSRNAKETAAG